MVTRFSTYAERRAHIRELFEPLNTAIERLESNNLGGTTLPRSDTTGWPNVDAQVAQLRIRVANCVTPEDAQAVGLLCRDIIISLADVVHNAQVHGDVGTSAVDRLNAAIDHIAPGEENTKLRRLLKATIDYANVVQHRRNGTIHEATLIAEATVAATNLMRRAVSAT